MPNPLSSLEEHEIPLRLPKSIPMPQGKIMWTLKVKNFVSKMVRSMSIVAKGKGESGSARVKSLHPIYSTVVDPAAFIELAGLPPSAEVKIPGSDEEAFDCPEGYVVMYEYPFTIGFEFPFTPLARSFIEVFHLSPGQLMPQIWRVFTVVHGVTANWRTPFDLSDLMYTYDLALQKCCRYTLVTKKGKKNLGVGLGVNDKGWQSRFVYVSKDSLGDKGQFLVEGWTTEGVYCVGQEVSCREESRRGYGYHSAPSFLGDDETAVTCPFADRLILPTTYRRYHEVDPLPVASDAAEHSLWASQAALAVRRQCSLLCDEVTNARKLAATAKKAAVLWEAKWKAAEKKVVDLAAVVKAKGDQLKGKDDQIADTTKDLEKVKGELASTTEELDGLRSLYDALQEEAKDVEALAIWRTRAHMMYSCLIGEISVWPCQKEVDDYLANGGTMANLSVPVVDSEELAKTADTASTEAMEVDAALSAENVPVSGQEGEVLAVQHEGEASVVAPQGEALDVASVEVPVVTDVVVPPEQESE
ncbi:hypothetical protein SOVF_078400 [Spinacia oleracea]|nr:hypothetical protein SOVF_078400 [Spinacia oleracea]